MKVVHSRKPMSEVERFATCFHQDFGVLDGGDDLVASHIAQLTPSQRATLKAQLEALLRENPGKEQKGLRNAWRRLGADWPLHRGDLRTLIEGWIGELEATRSRRGRRRPCSL